MCGVEEDNIDNGKCAFRGFGLGKRKTEAGSLEVPDINFEVEAVVI